MEEGRAPEGEDVDAARAALPQQQLRRAPPRRASRRLPCAQGGGGASVQCKKTRKGKMGKRKNMPEIPDGCNSFNLPIIHEITEFTYVKIRELEKCQVLYFKNLRFEI